MKKTILLGSTLSLAASTLLAAQQLEIAKWDPDMAIADSVVTNDVRWIDGTRLPIEGRAFTDTERYYDRLPDKMSKRINYGVRDILKHDTAGLQFRFVTDSKELHLRWKPLRPQCYMDHMPATGASGIDVYRFDAEKSRWIFVKAGRPRRDGADLVKDGVIDIPWTPGTPCLVNLPLYNGIAEFSLGIDAKAKLDQLPPRKSGITKPVVFYGTSITQGGCASRPGMAFPSVVGRDLDVPIVNLGFSGSGRMELEMADVIARIDASCYVIDCLWNMKGLCLKPGDPAEEDLVAAGVTTDAKSPANRAKYAEVRYEKFIRALRAKRPNVPIVMAEACDVYERGPDPRDLVMRGIYKKLIAEGWKNLVYLPKKGMFPGDGEGTVDGAHATDLGMSFLARRFGAAVREALWSAGGKPIDAQVGLGWENGWVKEWRMPPAGLSITETCERLGEGFERRVRRWKWKGSNDLERVTLAVRIPVAGDPKALKPFIPGVLMYGNPSNIGKPGEAVPTYAGEPGEFAIFEDHRPPMPFVLAENAATGAFTVLHTVPSPIRGAKHDDQWWSFGVEATKTGADLVLLSGPIGYNRKRSVAKAQQRFSMPYDEAYVTLHPGQIVEKVYYVETGVAKDGRFGFEYALDRCLDLYKPYDAARYPSVRQIAKAKRDYAMTRWYDDGKACGFLMYDPATKRREFVMGWCGCAATCGWALPVLNFDPSDVAKAQRSLDFLATRFLPAIHADTGLFDVRYEIPTDTTTSPDPVSCGQSLYSFMKAIRHAAKDSRLDATKWRVFAEKAARTYAKRVLRDDWTPPKSTAEGFYVAPLVLAAEIFSAPECLAAAERIAAHFEKEYFGYDRVYWGGTLDASCEDKEGAYAAFQGYLELLEHAVRTNDAAAEKRYARLARHAMDLMLTYTMVWDASYPPGRLADHAFKSTGWTFVSAQNQHLDAFGVLTSPEIARMGRYLKDERLVKLADVMYRSCFQLTSADGSLGEQIQHTNFGQRGKSAAAEGYRGGYSENWTVFWLTAHFLNAAASL